MFRRPVRGLDESVGQSTLEWCCFVLLTDYPRVQRPFACFIRFRYMVPIGGGG